MNIFEEIGGLVSNKISAMNSLYVLMKHEAKLAGLSIVPLIASAFALCLILTTTWITVLVLIGYGVQLLIHNILLSILLVFFLNLSMLFVFFKYLLLNVKNMRFEKTRAYFSKEGNIDEPIPKQIAKRDRRTKPKLKLSQ